MYRVETLKDYLSNDKLFCALSLKMYRLTYDNNKNYPNYEQWYFTRHLPSIVTDERNILFVPSNKDENSILAIAFLKKNNEEQKICTLYVSKEYRGLGIGTLIIEESMKWLGTTKPLITLPDCKLNMFVPLIEKYSWELVDVVEGVYKNDSKELCFNGTLINKKDLCNRFTKSIKKHISDIESK